MNTFFVYILLCNDESYYIGHTDNIDERLSKHQAGCASYYTTKRLPIKLVFFQEFSSRTEAFLVERRLKKWTRAKKKALVLYGWNALKSWKKEQTRSTHYIRSG